MRARRILLTALATAGLPMAVTAADLAEIVRSGDRTAALAAIRSGADVNMPAGDGSSPLLWAVYRLDGELAAELLARGAQPDARNQLGATPLTQAAELGDSAMVAKLLAAHADANLGNDDEQTPLMLAARAGSLPMVEALVKAGAKVNARERFRGQTALMWAIGANSPQVVEFLIRHGAEVDNRAASNDWGNQITSEPRAQYRPTGGLTPLLYATRSGCVDCVKALLAAGAGIDRPTPEGVTPLMNAIDNGHYRMANYLLDRGANPHLADWWGRTAVYLAVDMQTRDGAGGEPDDGTVPGRTAGGVPGIRSTEAAAVTVARAPLQLLQRLLEMGADPNIQLGMHRPFRGRFTDDLITTGCSPLLRAAISADRESAALLLKHGALPDLPNVMGVTPLMAAAGIGQGIASSGQGMRPMGADPEADTIAVIDLLIAAGADVNARITDTSSHTAIIARPSSMTDKQGQTAIFGAIGRSRVRVVQHLIEKGARLDVQDAAGKTVLDVLTKKAGGRDEDISAEMVQFVKQAVGA